MLRCRWVVLTVLLLLAGALLRSIAAPAGRAGLAPEAQTGRFSWPWGARAAVTVYFPAGESDHLIPVARKVASPSPEAALAELLAGPAPGQPLRPAVPAGVRLVGVRVDEGRALVDLEGGPVTDLGLRAMAMTLGVEQLQTRTGQAVRVDPSGTQLFYMHRGLILPVRVSESLAPREALEQLLTRPAPEGVAWLPPGIGVDQFTVKGSTAYVRLRFSPELQTLVESGLWNFAPYYLGVVYTLTEFPEIDRVRFEFAGLSPLALKQCRTPLSVALQRLEPEAGRAQEVRR